MSLAPPRVGLTTVRAVEVEAVILGDMLDAGLDKAVKMLLLFCHSYKTLENARAHVVARRARCVSCGREPSVRGQQWSRQHTECGGRRQGEAAA